LRASTTVTVTSISGLAHSTRGLVVQVDEKLDATLLHHPRQNGFDPRSPLHLVLVGQFEFLEWTGENHLRHSRFIALRDDKKAEDVRRE